MALSVMHKQLKAIRAREEHLDQLHLILKADSADKRIGPEHENLVQQTDVLHCLRAEIGSLDVDIMSQDAAIDDFKRTATRFWMGLECCEKGVVRHTYLALFLTRPIAHRQRLWQTRHPPSPFSPLTHFGRK